MPDNSMNHASIAAVPGTIEIAEVSALLSEFLLKAFPASVKVGVTRLGESSTLIDRLAGGYMPDILLLGSSFDGRSTSARPLLEARVKLGLPTKVIALTEDRENRHAILLLLSGVRGILDARSLKFEELEETVGKVYRGEICVSSSVIGHLVELLKPGQVDLSKSDGTSLLTPREQQVLSCLADGLTNHEIAKELKISEHTVKNHLFRVFEKLNVTNRTEAVVFAIRHRKEFDLVA